MEFRLTDDQLALQAAVERHGEANWSVDRLTAAEGRPLRTTTWPGLVSLDVFRVATPVERDGLGLGAVELAVVFEALGAWLVPGPLVWTALAAQHVASLADGTRVVGGLDAAAAAASPVLVEHPHDLDALLVLHDDGATLLDPFVADVDDVTATDPLTPVGLASSLPSGALVGDARLSAAMSATGELLTAAQLVGIAERAVRAGVAYANEREQFGRPIGSFQAIKHLLADCYVRTSLARSALYAAAAMHDDPGTGDAARATSAAKLLALDAAVRNARTCIQVHGGMGFTWEMIPHYLLKRAWVLGHSFGGEDVHGDRLAAALEVEVR